jgi:hypothetical protein
MGKSHFFGFPKPLRHAGRLSGLRLGRISLESTGLRLLSFPRGQTCSPRATILASLFFAASRRLFRAGGNSWSSF